MSSKLTENQKSLFRSSVEFEKGVDEMHKALFDSKQISEETFKHLKNVQRKVFELFNIITESNKEQLGNFASLITTIYPAVLFMSRQEVIDISEYIANNTDFWKDNKKDADSSDPS